MKSFGIAPVFVTIHIVAVNEKDMICNIMQLEMKLDAAEKRDHRKLQLGRNYPAMQDLSLA
jgi:hypothetical protein